jgi:hypothetical protein
MLAERQNKPWPPLSAKKPTLWFQVLAEREQEVLPTAGIPPVVSCGILWAKMQRLLVVCAQGFPGLRLNIAQLLVGSFRQGPADLAGETNERIC